MDVHIYYGIVSLVQEITTDGRGWPWKLARNRDSQPRYAEGACPTVESLFERSTVIVDPLPPD
jgi:hypothetical protein